MKLLITIFSISLLTGFSCAETEQLPADSKALLQKLQEWRLERQIELKQGIKKRRMSVMSLLKQQMDAATKQGDLDGAIAIRKQIETLNAGNSEKAEPGASNSKQSGDDWMVGTRWTVVREELDTFELEFFKGKLKASSDSRFFDYKIGSEGAVTYKGLFREITLRFNKGRKSGTYQDDKGTKGTIELIEG